MTDPTTGGYAGDVVCELSRLTNWQETPTATLVDVRTAAEWAYVGVPVLHEIGKAPSSSSGMCSRRASWFPISSVA